MVPTRQRSDKTTEGKKGKSKQMETINPHAAGIDIGSEVHYVAVDPCATDKPVRTFGCYTPDLHHMADWLKQCGVTTVAMESTGVYWMSAYHVLQERGFEVYLVDARHVKNVPGRKSDVADCQWIQRLHSYGLLRSCFLPDAEIAPLREYWRHRDQLVKDASGEILHIHKALEQMNLHIHKALSDITGVSGMNTVRSILSGTRDPHILAGMREPGVKKSEEELAKALTGRYEEEYLFTLEHAVRMYDTLQSMIKECDKKIQEYLRRFTDKADPTDLDDKKRKNNSHSKNKVSFDLEKELYRITGVDLTTIDGLGALTLQTVISECGIDLASKFPTEKHFCSWLTLGGV